MWTQQAARVAKKISTPMILPVFVDFDAIVPLGKKTAGTGLLQFYQS
jgi:hypothetical protein